TGPFHLNWMPLRCSSRHATDHTAVRDLGSDPRARTEPFSATIQTLRMRWSFVGRVLSGCDRIGHLHVTSVLTTRNVRMNGTRFLQCLSIVLLLSSAGGSAAHPPAKRHVRLDFHCEMSSLPDGAQTVDLWIPMFTTNDRQDIKLLNESDLRDGRMTKD